MWHSKQFHLILTIYIACLCQITNVYADTKEYHYDNSARLLKIIDGNNATIDYLYDNMGNRLQKVITLPGGPVNSPPGIVHTPSINDGAGDISLTPTLGWVGGGDPDPGDETSYYIYFGVSGSLDLVTSGTQESYNPGILEPLTEYCWQVNTRDSHNSETAGPLWCFTTEDIPFVASFGLIQVPNFFAIRFQDSSTSSALTNIVSWEWDFDGDGSIDSDLQNPAYIYTNGEFLVTLTITDALGASVTTTNLVRPDADQDNVADIDDNCPTVYNPGQLDDDGDGFADACTIYHCVNNSADLQSSLSSASNNNSNDIIRLVQGTYGVTGNPSNQFRFSSKEPYDLYLKGGYNVDCSERVIDPINTVLDGENVVPDPYPKFGVLQINNNNDKVLVITSVVEGLTVENGGGHYTGGLTIFSTTGNIVVSDTIVRANKGVYEGGLAVNSSSGTIRIENSTIVDNFVQTSTSGDVGGASLTNTSGLIHLINNTFDRNTGSVDVSAGSDTGGLVISNDSGEITLYGNTIVNNSGSYAGLKIQTKSGSVELVSSSIIANTVANTTGYDVGGVYISGEAGEVLLANNLIAENSGHYGGAEIYLSSSSAANNYPVRLINNTIVKNVGEYGGAYLVLYLDTLPQLDVYNNIFWGNSGVQVDDLYTYYQPGTVANGFNNVFDPAKVSVTFTSSENNANVDPEFVDIVLGDYHLSTTSPLVDNGLNGAPALPLFDLDREKRVIDGDKDDIGIVDIGSDERSFSGDINRDDLIDLTDLIMVLQIFTGTSPTELPSNYNISGIDVDGDARIGVHELFYIFERLNQ